MIAASGVDAVDQRQRRDRQQLVDAEMPTHRGDCGRLRARRLQAADQAGKDLGLPLGLPAPEVGRHLAHVGMRDGAFQWNAGGGVPVDQAAIIEVGRGGPNAADQSDMHVSMLRLALTSDLRQSHLD